MTTNEQTAIDLYDTYCAAVGGCAWNGAPLPSGTDFFADPNKQLQANAWRAVAAHARKIHHQNTNMDIKKEQVDKIASAAESRWGVWAKYIIGALVGALAAAGVITVTGCTVTTDQAQDLRALDAFLHEYGALIITVEDGK